MTDEAEVRRKAKGRKYMDARCELYIGWTEDSQGRPIVLRCEERKTKYYPEFGHFGMYLCDEHAEYRISKLGESAA